MRNKGLRVEDAMIDVVSEGSEANPLPYIKMYLVEENNIFSLVLNLMILKNIHMCTYMSSLLYFLTLILPLSLLMFHYFPLLRVPYSLLIFLVSQIKENKKI